MDDCDGLNAIAVGFMAVFPALMPSTGLVGLCGIAEGTIVGGIL